MSIEPEHPSKERQRVQHTYSNQKRRQNPRRKAPAAAQKEGLRVFFRLVGVMFIAFLVILIAAFFATPEKSYSSSEKRLLSQRPAVTLDSLASGQFMDGIEDYAADQFPFRDLWMRLKTSVSKFLGSKESQGVYLLKNGGLAERFMKPDAENFTDTMAAISAFSNRYPDTQMYFLLAPTAISVLSEELPDHAVTESQDEFIDQLYEALPENVTAIDVRPVFDTVSDKSTLYYRTDHHWTAEGALLAWNEAKSVMGIQTDVTFTRGTVTNRFYGSLVSKSGFSVDTPDEIQICLPDNAPADFVYTVNYPDEMRRTASVYDLQALNSDDPYTVFFGSNHPLVEIDTTIPTDRKLLVIKDSYANCFVPFMLTEFQKIDLLDPRYYYDNIDVLMQSEGFTDILFLYNVNTYAADTSLKTVLINRQ